MILILDYSTGHSSFFFTITAIITLCYLVLASNCYPLGAASYRNGELPVNQQPLEPQERSKAGIQRVRNRNEEYYFAGPNESSSSTLTTLTLLAIVLGVPCFLCYASKSSKFLFRISSFALSHVFVLFTDSILFPCFKVDDQLANLASNRKSKRSKSARERKRKRRQLRRNKSRRRAREDSSSEEDSSSPDVDNESDSNSDNPRGERKRRNRNNNKRQRSKSVHRGKKRRKSRGEKNNKDEDQKDKPTQKTANRGQQQQGKLSTGLLQYSDTSPMSSLKTGDNKLSTTFDAKPPVEYAHIVYRPDTNSVAISRSLKDLLPANTTVVYKVDETSKASEVGGLMKSIKRRFYHDAEVPSPPSSPNSGAAAGGGGGKSLRSKYYIVNSDLLLKGDQAAEDEDALEGQQQVNKGKTAAPPLKMSKTMFVYSTKTHFAKWPGLALAATPTPSLFTLHKSIHQHQQQQQPPAPEGDSHVSEVNCRQGRRQLKRKREEKEASKEEEDVENEESSDDDEIEEQQKAVRRRRHRQLARRKHNKHHRLKGGHKACVSL